MPFADRKSRQDKWNKRSRSLRRKTKQLAEMTDGQVALFLCDRGGRSEKYISTSPAWNARFENIAVNGAAEPPTGRQRVNSSIADGNSASESIVVDGSQSLALELHLRSTLEVIQEDSDIQDPQGPESLDLQDMAPDCVAEISTLPWIAESTLGLPAVPESDIPRTKELDQWGLVATHLVAARPSTLADCDMMDSSVPESGKSQIRSPMLETTDESNCWEAAGNPLVAGIPPASPERPTSPVDYDTIKISVPDSGRTRFLSQLPERSNTNIGVEISVWGTGSVNEACSTISDSLAGQEGANENHLQGCDQENVRQASMLEARVLIDRSEWVFVDQHPRQPKIDIRQLIERWDWVFPKDGEYRPGSRSLGSW